ncbi:MAG: tetratricopeptide repeat protein [Cyanobacteria bacterium J06632_22]
MDARTNRLLRSLQDVDEAVREQATAELWHDWFHQKGKPLAQELFQTQSLLESGQTQTVEDILNRMIDDHPDFAEAWNRRAVLYYVQRKYRKAITDCEVVISRVPYHFGALHGLGLCQAAIGDYPAAIHAFREALEVQPFSLTNQRLILECTARLS